MAQKSLGHVELEWTCPSCSTRNPGTKKKCVNCGLPQPDNVEFEQPAQETFVTDEAKLKVAKGGPDVHCYYCGSRNSADAAVCTQCGADLSEAGKRSHGKTLGAHRSQAAEPITCPACGTFNDPKAPDCVQCGASLVEPAPAPPPVPQTAAPAAPKPEDRSGFFGKVGLIGLIVLVCIVGAVCVFFFNQTEDITGTVSGSSWERTIEIEELVPVTYEAWHDDIPAGARRGSCSPKLRRTQDNPEPASREVCGTPYTVDTGTGFGEVVQDCKYEIYEDFCEYSVEEWQNEADEASATGSDSIPRWPELNLGPKQREGERTERYVCHFSTETGQYSYGSSNENLLNLCQRGTRWELEINTFDMVTDIQQAR